MDKRRTLSMSSMTLHSNHHDTSHTLSLGPRLLTDAKRLGNKIKLAVTTNSNINVNAVETPDSAAKRLQTVIEAEKEKDMAKHIHGNLSCVLPFVDQSKNTDEPQDKLNTQQQLTYANSFDSDISHSQDEKQNEENIFARLRSNSSRNEILQMPSHQGSKQLMTPGEVRLSVLNWLYEEKDIENADLNLQNMTILTELIPPFVSVVLNGKSDYIRSRVWSYLLKCSAQSTHFAFLAICALQASQSEDPAEILSDTHKSDAIEIDSLVGTNFKSMNNNLSKLKEVSQPHMRPIFEQLEQNMSETMKVLEKVKHKHVLRHIDNSSKNRTSRKNIEFLIGEVKNGIVDKKKVTELNHKLSFIKTLTDLDEYLRQKIDRNSRLKVLKESLSILNKSLPNGSYVPVACDSAFENHQILHIVVDETIVFNTAQKCPFLLVMEIQDTFSPFLNTPDSLGVKQNGYFELSDLSLHHLSTNGSNSESDADQAESTKNGLGTPKTFSYEAANQRETWEEMVFRVKQESEFKTRPNWRLAAMFVKSGDDLRQQQLGVFLISTFQKIFLEEQVFVKLFPFKIIATTPSSGLLEPAKNGDSIARLKERHNCNTLDEYFYKQFGEADSPRFKKAQENFMRSLAGYSIVSYLMKLHDRHNGNILIDTDGHFMHIDYGFMLGYGHTLERSPFKLTQDFVNILDGPNSKTFQSFRRLMEQAFIAACRHQMEIVLLVQLMAVGSTSLCFAGGRRWVLDELKERFCPGASKRKLRKIVNNLIDYSMGNYTTRCYDKYQRCVNGIF